MFRRFRIVILLLILMFLGLGTLLDRFYATRWNAPFVVAVYPINADGSPATDAYISKLDRDDYLPLERFFEDEARTYHLKIEKPFRIMLAPPLKFIPPKPPVAQPNVLKIILWSLRLRWWAFQVPPKPPGPTPRIRLFLLYHDAALNPKLDHSTGLSKGRLGIVNLFAARSESGSNQTVIAHELLHTLGATDKYHPNTTLPKYPEGFAEPAATPRYPQRRAELMGGRVPLSENEARIPDALGEVMIGTLTAREIGWLKN